MQTQMVNEIRSLFAQNSINSKRFRTQSGMDYVKSARLPCRGQSTVFRDTKLHIFIISGHLDWFSNTSMSVYNSLSTENLFWALPNP